MLLVDPIARCDQNEKTAIHPTGQDGELYARLSVGSNDTWGRCWQMLERYLEENAPSIFIIIEDWIPAQAIIRLSDRIKLVAFICSDEETEYEHIVQQGALLNAIITPNNYVHWKFVHRFPHLATRTINLQMKENDESNSTLLSASSEVADACGTLFEQIELMADREQFMRPRGWMQMPSLPTIEADNAPRPDLQKETDWVNSHPLWPNAPLHRGQKLNKEARGTEENGTAFKPLQPRPVLQAERIEAERIEAERIIVSCPGGRISGADIAIVRLVQQLRQKGMDARVVGATRYWDSTALDLETNIGFEPYPIRWDAPWAAQWQGFIDYLEALAPCIYLPISDFNHEAVVPRLSNRIKVVTIVHRDEPEQYARALRLGRYSNAVVGTSDAIVRHLASLDPSLQSRLVCIPNGAKAVSSPNRSYEAHTCLRLVYVGRLDNYQRRCDDLLKLASHLHFRQIPFELTLIGDGPDGESLREGARDLVETGKVRFLGTLPNAEVLKILEQQDIFLMPAAFTGCSVSLLEAMGRGLVPIVTDLRSGIPELLSHGVNGFIVPVGDVDRYIDHLIALYETPALLERIGRAAYETVASGYRLEEMVERYLTLFANVVCERDSGHYVRVPGKLVAPAHLEPYTGWQGVLDLALYRLQQRREQK